MRSVKIKIMDEIIVQAKDIKLMVPERIHPVIYKLVVARKIRQEDLVYFAYWINKINKWMKYLAGWQAFFWLAASGCFDLVWRC